MRRARHVFPTAPFEAEEQFERVVARGQLVNWSSTRVENSRSCDSASSSLASTKCSMLEHPSIEGKKVVRTADAADGSNLTERVRH